MIIAASATLALVAALGRVPPEEFDACTSIMVSRGATVDGSTMITYSADAPFMPKLLRHEGGPKKEGEAIDIVGWEDDRVRGQVRQVAHTYSVVGLMNEHQLAIGETTTGGRRELRDPNGLLDYDALIWLTLQRAETAREAIDTIESLCAEYGYGSSGETFAIADKHEVWVMELIGRGDAQRGILWVAARVPEGHISASANMSRITTFPTDDPDNWRFAADVESFAVEHGYYDPTSGEPFRFRDAYHPDVSPLSKRVCGSRIWSIYRRVCPDGGFASDFHRGVDGAEDYPLFVRPDAKLSVRDVMGLMRDHYEGTDLDMTQGVDAGPFSSPYRFRGLTFEVDGQTYGWERPIATQQAGFVMLSQCREWLPDPVGGVYWYTPDDPYTSAFTPLYCGITALPPAYAVGDYDRFSWNSAWWIFNLASNLTYDRWSRVLPTIQSAQREAEETVLAMMPAIDRAASELCAQDEALARRFLTDWSVGGAERLFERWRDLVGEVIVKHVDGYVKDDRGRSRGVGYSEEWLRRVVEERGAQLALPRSQESRPAVEPQEVSFPTPDGGTVYADEYGRGARGVVLAHGARFDKASWREQALALAAAGFRVVAIDFRGYGKSRGGDPTADRYEGLHFDVLGAVRYLRGSGATDVSVVGGSMGGFAAANAAVASDEGEIDHVVLLAHSSIEHPERMKGRKLFVTARDDFMGSGTLRLPAIRDQYERAPGPKELLILDGEAHAQHLFATDQGPALQQAIQRFLEAP